LRPATYAVDATIADDTASSAANLPRAHVVGGEYSPVLAKNAVRRSNLGPIDENAITHVDFGLVTGIARVIAAHAVVEKL
jgi:hypothetical protein